MGLPVFRESAAAHTKPAIKTDPSAHTRSTIRRQRTIREPRRQAEVYPRYWSVNAEPQFERDRLLERQRELQALETHARRALVHATRENRIRPHAHFSPRTRHPIGDVSAGRERAGSVPFQASIFMPDESEANSRDMSARSRRLEMLQDSGPRPLHDRHLGLPQSPLLSPSSVQADLSLPSTFVQSSVASSVPTSAREQRQSSQRPPSRRGPMSVSARTAELEGFPPLRRYGRRRVTAEWTRATPVARPRSWSPESDQWETMLSTITPDAHLPSTDSSFSSAVASASSNSANSSTTRITAPSAPMSNGQDSPNHACEDDSCNGDEASDSESERIPSRHPTNLPPRAPSPPVRRTWYWPLSQSNNEDGWQHSRYLTRTPDSLPSLSRSDSQDGNAPGARTRPDEDSVYDIHESILNGLIHRHALYVPNNMDDFHVLPSEVRALREALSSSSSRIRTSPVVLLALQIVNQAVNPITLNSSNNNRANLSDDFDFNAFLRTAPFGERSIPPPSTESGARLSANPYAIDRDIETNAPRLPSPPSTNSNAHPSPPATIQTRDAVAAGTEADVISHRSQSTSNASLARSFMSHAAEYSRRHMPGVHDEDAEGELDQMRRILERLAQSGDVPEAWWASAGLRREV